jgi:hypothetical protein
MSTPSLKVIKLVSGDEIIGVVQDGATETNTDDGYTLDNLLFVTNPMKVVSEYDPTAKVHALYLIDWIPAIRDTTLPLDKQRVITLGDPNKNLEAHYIDLVLMDKLYEQLTEAESTGDIEDDLSPEERVEKHKLSEKLKKHKFEDDDIQ